MLEKDVEIKCECCEVYCREEGRCIRKDGGVFTGLGV